MKIEKISNYAYLACIAIIVVVFALFYLGGETIDEASGLEAPVFTETVIFLMYALIVVCAGLMIWSLVKGAAAGGTDDAKTGVPATKIGIVAIVILVVAVALGAALGSSDAITLADGSVVEGFNSWLSDTMIISMEILAVVAALGLVANLVFVGRK